LQNSHTTEGVFGKASFFVASRIRRHIVTEKSGDVAPQAEEGGGHHPDADKFDRRDSDKSGDRK